MLKGLRVFHLLLIMAMAAKAMTTTTVLLRHAEIPPINDDVADIVEILILTIHTLTTPMTSTVGLGLTQTVAEANLDPPCSPARKSSKFPTMSSVPSTLTKELPTSFAKLCVAVPDST